MLDPRADLIDLISDVHKDARGFRPRGMYNYAAMSLADLGALVESLSQEAQDAYEADRLEAIELDRMWRDDVALGVVAPDDTVKLEPWEVWAARCRGSSFYKQAQGWYYRLFWGVAAVHPGAFRKYSCSSCR